jgi:anti-anti-sigma regulatory factor
MHKSGGTLSIEQITIGHRTVVAVEGEVTVAELSAALDRAHDAHPSELWLDLTGAGVADGAKLGEMLSAHRATTPGLALIGPDDALRRVLDGAVPIYDSRAAAHSAS